MRPSARSSRSFGETLGHDPESVVIVGSGSSATVQIRSETLTNDKTEKLRNALFDKYHPKGADGQPSKLAISDSAVSSTWGGQITKKAVIALVVFLVLVSLYITVRYERYMAISALTTMVFDLTVTAGIYSLVGFEVTPATVIGLLTILGFSLYDTVIVFDKVEENTHAFQHTARRTFAEEANLAVNQTFMRSINTSLISTLPVMALMVVAVWLLGVGTLKDLALVQLVGIIVGTYSSIFFATPLLVTLRERTELVRTHTRRVIRRRGPEAGKAPDKGQGGRRAPSRTTTRGPPSGRAHRSRPPVRQRRASPPRARDPYGSPPAAMRVRPASRTNASPMIAWRRRAAVSWLVVMLAAAAPGALTACSGSAAGQVDYIVDGALDTYNTNTVGGAASAGAQAFARTLTGFGYHGPDGQVVADHDFGTISIVGGSPLVLDYQIADNAVYSDGKPVTCDDLVLTWAAQSGRFPGFDAASQAGYVDVTSIDCQPGQKKARVSFAPDRNIVDYNQLFTATAILPSHVIADELGVDVTRGAAGQQPTGHRAHRAAVEHHLEPQAGHGFGRDRQALPVVGALQDRIGAGRRRSGSRRQRPLVGRQADDQTRHGVAAESRHPGPGQRQERRCRRRRGRLLRGAGHTRQLPPHRCAVGRHRAADFRAAWTARGHRGPPRTCVLHSA